MHRARLSGCVSARNARISAGVGNLPMVILINSAEELGIGGKCRGLNVQFLQFCEDAFVNVVRWRGGNLCLRWLSRAAA